LITSSPQKVRRTLVSRRKALTSIDSESAGRSGFGRESTRESGPRHTFAENVWPSDIELSTNPVAAAWQLAAISPLNALDQLALLGSTSFEELLARVSGLTREAALAFDAPWPDDEAE
jgi:hypothetical protein